MAWFVGIFASACIPVPQTFEDIPLLGSSTSKDTFDAGPHASVLRKPGFSVQEAVPSERALTLDFCSVPLVRIFSNLHPFNNLLCEFSDRRFTVEEVEVQRETTASIKSIT